MNAKELNDAIIAFNEKESDYWQRVGGHPEDTYQAGFNERYKLMLRELEREGL